MGETYICLFFIGCWVVEEVLPILTIIVTSISTNVIAADINLSQMKY